MSDLRQWEDLRRTVAEMWGYDIDTWPTHGNAPLAIAAGIALREGEATRLRQWVDDLQSGQYVNCIYCGHQYGPGETTPVSMSDALKAHIEQCPEHPMSALRAENDRLREQVRVAREAIQGFLDNPRRTSPLSRHKMASALAQLDATAPAEGASE